MTKYLKILHHFSKPHWFEIVHLIKRSQGMSVGELSAALEMSYMGIKKHCLAMQKLGYLDTWRRPKDVGRPEKLYRLTAKLDPLFPGIGDSVCVSLLEAAEQLDSNAGEKLLFQFFRIETERLSQVIASSSVQGRAEKLAEEREGRGYFSSCHYSEEDGLRIEEYHNPLKTLFDRYPTLERMELQMFERLLGARVERSVRISSGLTCYCFDLFPK